jgi:hypothetical protein
MNVYFIPEIDRIGQITWRRVEALSRDDAERKAEIRRAESKANGGYELRRA